MASSGLDNNNAKQTRLQETTEKRRAEDELKQREELKRRKKMFAPRKVIGPRDLLVNSNLPKIKLEEDVECIPSIKEEPLEADPKVIRSNDSLVDSNVQKINLVKKSSTVEDTLDLEEFTIKEQLSEHHERVEQSEAIVEHVEEKSLSSETQQRDSSSETDLYSDDDKFSQKHIQFLKALNDQKEQEINVLIGVVNGLQYQCSALDTLSVYTEIKNEQFVLIDSNINKGKVLQAASSENALVVARLTSDLMGKHAKIKILSMKMLKLQDKIFSTANHSLEISKNYKTSGDFVQESFKLILPFLYLNLQLNDILICRKVCQSWRNTADQFLDTHPSGMPFDMETHLEEKRVLEIGPIPAWKESPLQKLYKIYQFSSIEVLKRFTDDGQGTTILGSTVCLDNLILNNYLNMNAVTRFLKIFDVHIKFLVIRQCVELPDFKIPLLMDRVKLCLKKLPNLERFKLVFCIDGDRLERENSWDVLEAMGNKMFPKSWQPSSFPKLEKLCSLELELEVEDGYEYEWTEQANFLQNFSKSLIQPYSEQLKKLSIITPGIDPSDCLVFPNLVQLSISLKDLSKVEFKCQHVQKCTITEHRSMMCCKDISTIKTLFPELTCLGFRLEDVGEQFYHRFLIPCSGPSNYNPTIPQIHNVKTLELENCGAITFTILEAFPNLEFIKLFNRHTLNEIEDSEEDVLEITKLWKGESLYESGEFWEHFPNISLVTLEFSGGEPSANIKPKLCRWTRDGYAKYLCGDFEEDILQM